MVLSSRWPPSRLNWMGLTWTPLSDLQRRARSGSSPCHPSEGWAGMAMRVGWCTRTSFVARWSLVVVHSMSSMLRTLVGHDHAGECTAGEPLVGGTR